MTSGPASLLGGCCGSTCPLQETRLTRRSFFAGIGATAGGLALGRPATTGREAGQRIDPYRKTLQVQPVLVYGIHTRREGTSWRPWGGIHSAGDVSDERNRISQELVRLQSLAEFPLEIRSTQTVSSTEEAAAVAAKNHDVLIMYAAGGSVATLEALVDPAKWTLVFLRHRSGPVYLWYEIVSNRFLRKTVDEFGQPSVGTRDVVVDQSEELLWRLRSLAGLKNTLCKKIVCVGGASGWGVGGRKAPELTKQRFGMTLADVSYDELGDRLLKANQDSALIGQCREASKKYLDQQGIRLETSAEFVHKAFVLTEVFRELLSEHQTDAITINQCMGTIMEVSGTTACLPLSILNDEGCLAFCESDFVVIPSGVLLHYISGKPVFFNDPTYPHDGLVTLAHCTAPRMMDGSNPEPVRILTHFESDWGAAPKVELKLGQNLTVVDPDFNFERWMGFEAEVADNPFLDICRSQIDITFRCDTDRLNEETRGFHWMACYGNYLSELEYAVQKAGLQWLTLA